MKLGKVFSECELTEFFGSAPELDDTPDEREFFARNTFTVDSGDVRLELSLDPYTPQVTIELFAAKDPPELNNDAQKWVYRKCRGFENTMLGDDKRLFCFHQPTAAKSENSKRESDRSFSRSSKRHNLNEPFFVGKGSSGASQCPAVGRLSTRADC